MLKAVSLVHENFFSYFKHNWTDQTFKYIQNPKHLNVSGS